MNCFESIPEEVVALLIFRYLDPFELSEACHLVSSRWNLLAKQSLRKRRYGSIMFDFLWKIHQKKITPSLLRLFVKLEVFNMEENSQKIIDFCSEDRRMSKFWKVVWKINTKYGGLVEHNPMKIRIKMTYPMNIASPWLASCDIPLKGKFDLICEKKNSVVAVILFALFIEGHIDEVELEEGVVYAVNKLTKGSTKSSILGLLKLVDIQGVFEKLPALFTNDIFYSVMEYTKIEHVELSAPATRFCKTLLQKHESLPNFVISLDEDIEIFKKILRSKSLKTIRALFESIMVPPKPILVEEFKKAYCEDDDYSLSRFIIDDLLSIKRSIDWDRNLLLQIPTNRIFLLKNLSLSKILLENQNKFPNVNIPENDYQIFVDCCGENDVLIIQLFLTQTEIANIPLVLVRGLESSVVSENAHPKNITCLSLQKILQKTEFDPTVVFENIIRKRFSSSDDSCVKDVFRIKIVRGRFRADLHRTLIPEIFERYVRIFDEKTSPNTASAAENISFLLNNLEDEDIITYHQENVNGLMIYFLKTNCYEEFKRCVKKLNGDPTHNKCEAIRLLCQKLSQEDLVQFKQTYRPLGERPRYDLWEKCMVGEKREAEEEEEGEDRELYIQNITPLISLIFRNGNTVRLSYEEKKEIFDLACAKMSMLVIEQILKHWRGEKFIEFKYVHSAVYGRIGINNYNWNNFRSFRVRLLQSLFFSQKESYIQPVESFFSEKEFFWTLSRNNQFEVMSELIKRGIVKNPFSNYGVDIREFVKHVEGYIPYNHEGAIRPKFPMKSLHDLLDQFFSLKGFKKNIKIIADNFNKIRSWGGSNARKLIYQYIFKRKSEYLHLFKRVSSNDFIDNFGSRHDY